MTYASLMFCFVTEAKHKSEAKLRIWLRRLFLCVHALSMRALENQRNSWMRMHIYPYSNFLTHGFIRDIYCFFNQIFLRVF